MAQRTDPALERQIIEAYATMKSSRKVAAQFGVSPSTVLRILHRNDIAVLPPHRPRDVPSSLEEKIWQQYEAGTPGTEIASIFGVSEQTVYNIVRRTGHNVRRRSQLRTPERIQAEVINHYRLGESSLAIAEALQIHPETVLKIVRRNGYQVRSPRRYRLDEHFFDIIDSEKKSYWLGFLAADGCVYKGQLKLFLQERDKEHLKKFLGDLHANYPIRAHFYSSRKNYKTMGVELSSPKLVQALSRFGITPRKTFSLRPPEIPDELLPHFWRGMLDGDGHIGIVHIGHHAPTVKVSLVGTYAITNGFTAFVREFAMTRAVPHPMRHVWQVDFRGNQLPKLILHKLYDNATVYLDRKLERAKEVFALEPRLPHRVREKEISRCQVA